MADKDEMESQPEKEKQAEGGEKPLDVGGEAQQKSEDAGLPKPPVFDPLKPPGPGSSPPVFSFQQPLSGSGLPALPPSFNRPGNLPVPPNISFSQPPLNAGPPNFPPIQKADSGPSGPPNFAFPIPARSDSVPSGPPNLAFPPPPKSESVPGGPPNLAFPSPPKSESVPGGPPNLAFPPPPKSESVPGEPPNFAFPIPARSDSVPSGPPNLAFPPPSKPNSVPGGPPNLAFPIPARTDSVSAGPPNLAFPIPARSDSVPAGPPVFPPPPKPDFVPAGPPNLAFSKALSGPPKVDTAPTGLPQQSDVSSFPKLPPQSDSSPAFSDRVQSSPVLPSKPDSPPEIPSVPKQNLLPAQPISYAAFSASVPPNFGPQIMGEAKPAFGQPAFQASIRPSIPPVSNSELPKGSPWVSAQSPVRNFPQVSQKPGKAEESKADSAFGPPVYGFGQEKVTSTVPHKVQAPAVNPLDPNSLLEKLRLKASITKDGLRWACPICTCESEFQYIQCDACLHENKALQTLLTLLEMPGKMREKGRLEKGVDAVTGIFKKFW